MGVRFLLLAGALVGLMYLASWLGKASPAQRAAALRNIVIYGVAIALLILVLTGRIHWLFALLGAAAPWLQRGMLAMRAWNSFKAFRGPAAGQQSRVNTAWLAMTLDHDSGNIDGEVLAGAFTGQRLSAMSLDDLLQLLGECRAADPQSAALLEAFLDRHHGGGWRADDEQGDAGGSRPPPVSGPMSGDEAREILGVSEEADHREIRAAHRRLMQKMHPDRGGSAYLAARINEARDVLLEKGRR